MPFDFRPIFDRALPYGLFLERHATAENRARWQALYDAVSLTPAQLELLSSFRREMKVLCLAGPWCGDCVNACPIYERIAEASPLIDLRFINRAQNFDGAVKAAAGLPAHHGAASSTDRAFTDASDVAVAQELSLCGGPRVPVLVFLSEDGYECERYGERTLATYREKAMKKLASTAGASCPTGLVLPANELLTANTAEWLGHFERVQWMLLTSPRLSQKHGEM
jgi:thiol-disulfide isomerase/thioredoxin